MATWLVSMRDAGAVSNVDYLVWDGRQDLGLDT